MASFTSAQAATILRRLGWRVTSASSFRQAVANFQAGYALTAALTIDGICGPKTSAALRRSDLARANGSGTASRHFSFVQFRCHCGGRFASCQRIKVKRALILGLERYWSASGGNGTIVSGYRCPSHNRSVGGASESQHLYGGAADIAYRMTDRGVARLGVFSGIGRSKRTKLVRHVDVRASAGHNVTNGSNKRPTVWDYAK